MSTTAIRQSAVESGGAPARALDAAPSRLGGIKPIDIAILSVLGLAFIAVFFRWIEKQYVGFSWQFKEDWGHSYIVPLISGYYIWRERARLSSIPVATWWPGLTVLLTSILLYVYFIAGYSNHMFQGAAVVLAVAGLTMFILGPHVFRALVLPIAYLGFAITISEMVMNKITWQLKLLASKGSWIALNVLGVDTDIDGNILRITSGSGDVIPLNVADACSGMRMVIAFIALAAAVAMFSCRHWWQRIAILLLSVPVALLMNVVRVTVLGLLSLINPELSVGEAHTFIGTLLLFPAFLLFMFCVWALNRVVRDEPVAKGAPA